MLLRKRRLLPIGNQKKRGRKVIEDRPAAGETQRIALSRLPLNLMLKILPLRLILNRSYRSA